jgi:hypothetical protein
MVRKRFFMYLFLILLGMIVLPFCTSAAVLFDQPLSSTNVNPYTSQYDNPPGDPNQSIYIADDFSNADTWDISTIVIPGALWAGTSLISTTSLHWAIYADSAGVPAGYPGGGAAPLWSISLAPTADKITLSDSGSDVTLNLLAGTTPATAIRLTPNKYWLVFYPEASYNVVGWGRQPSDVAIAVSDSVAKVINPGGGFSWGAANPNTWIDWNSIGWATTLTQDNTAFRLEGNVVTAGPNVLLSPSSIPFGSVLVNTTTAPQAVTISNTGTITLTVSNITIVDPDSGQFAKATGGTCATVYPINLAAGGSCTQNVTFTPTSVGAKAARLAVTSNDGDTPTAYVALSGTGIAPDIAVAPASLAFDPTLVGVTAVAKTVTITNNGGAQLNVTNITITGANPGEFAKATGGTCATVYPINLAAGGSCTQNVTFTPTSVGAKAATLAVTSNDGDTPTANVPLTGTGIAGIISVTEGTIGTVITITGNNFGDTKGKVYLGDKAIKVFTDGWTPTQITCTVNKVPLPGETAYDLTIQPKPKGTPEIRLSNAFTVKKPEINESTSDNHGAPEAEATIQGMWFGSKKGKVYLGEQKCKVESWAMDPATGESTIVFVVHKKIGAGSYPLQVENKIGRSVSTTLFAVP